LGFVATNVSNVLVSSRRLEILVEVTAPAFKL
jgi:hypothetical protein